MKKEGNWVKKKVVSNNIKYLTIFTVAVTTAVQNERDRISSRRPSYEEPVSANGLTISVLINAETMSRQVNLVISFLFVKPLNMNITYTSFELFV